MNYNLQKNIFLFSRQLLVYIFHWFSCRNSICLRNSLLSIDRFISVFTKLRLVFAVKNEPYFFNIETELGFIKTKMKNCCNIHFFKNPAHLFRWVLHWSKHIWNSSFDMFWSYIVEFFLMFSASSNLLETRGCISWLE